MAEQSTLLPLYSTWGENINKECPLNDYPRPQLRRDNWQCLNGTWQYAICKGDAAPQEWDGKILVPFSPEALLSGVGRQLLPGQTLWYEREIKLQKPENGRLILHFGAVDQKCRVWCNGQFLGEHAGGYWPFFFDITERLGGETATITVAVTDESNTGSEAYGKQTLERGGIWYTGQSGIWQTVWCETVPQEYIENLRITPLWREGAVEISVSGVSTGAVRVLDGESLAEQGVLKDGFVRIELPDFKSWSTDDPFLYDLEIRAGEDTVYSYFGMREFGLQKGADGVTRLALNGKPIFHNGLLDQGYWSDGMYTPPSDEAMVWDIEKSKEMGFNMLRKHIKIEPLRWYYHCDRLGMLVWQDFVSGGGPYKTWVVQYAPWLGMKFSDGEKNYALLGRGSAAGRAAAIRDARRTVELLYNCVSLSVWVPFNEAWGQFDAARMCKMVRGMDNTRQIDHASGYFDQGEGDFHSYHIYYKRFHPQKDKYQNRVLALTEFGGYSLPTDGHMASKKLFGYKIFRTQHELFEQLKKLYSLDVIPAMKKGMGALIYTQVSDVEDEINGLFTYDRRVTKVDKSQMQALNKNLHDIFAGRPGKRMNREENDMKESKLTVKNYLGYAMCDVSGMLAFSVMGAYLSVFYTDILKISTFAVFGIMLVARIWDAVDDPVIGFIIQNRKSGKFGKYRPLLLAGGIPYAIVSFLVFVKIPGLGPVGYTIYAGVTYILSSIMYTIVLVPYGSLASVMTTKENERSTLSMCRSIGGGVGSLPAAMLFPVLVLVNNVLDEKRLLAAMAVLAVIMMLLYYLSFRWTRESADFTEDTEKIKIGETLKSIIKDKAFVIMALVGCLQMAAAMYVNTVNIYIFKDFYGKSGMLIFITLAAYIPMLAMMPFLNKLISRFGKKKLAIVGHIVSTAVSFLIFALRFSNPWLYIAATFFINIGIGFITLEVWAMATDVIDHQEWVTGKRAEAANYAIFTFMRKIGQAIAALAPLLVGFAGYNSDLVGTGQDPSTLQGMYTIATLVPFILFAVTLMLMIFYPLNKSTMEKMKTELTEMRSKRALDRG